MFFGDRELPEYIRVGKFMSKIRLEVLATNPVEVLPVGDLIDGQKFFKTRYVCGQ